MVKMGRKKGCPYILRGFIGMSDERRLFPEEPRATVEQNTVDNHAEKRAQSEADRERDIFEVQAGLATEVEAERKAHDVEASSVESTGNSSAQVLALLEGGKKEEDDDQAPYLKIHQGRVRRLRRQLEKAA